MIYLELILYELEILTLDMMTEGFFVVLWNDRLLGINYSSGLR